MCYFNSYTSPKTEIKVGKFSVPPIPFQEPMRSGFDYSEWPVIIPEAGTIKNEMMEWGFLPPYLPDREAVNRFRFGYKEPSGKYNPPITTLNAIAEEILEKPMYKKAAENSRCLVLSSGFYEWRHLPKIGKKGQPLKATDKFPYFIKLKEKDYFFMAGIFNTWTDKKTGETVETFSICTTAANKLMQHIHNSKNRMPLILPEDLAVQWIKPDLSENEIKKIANFHISEKLMEAHTVDKNFKEKSNPQKHVLYTEIPEIYN